MEDVPKKSWSFAVDARDVLASVGATAVLVGAAAIHWALALVVLGGSLLALSYRLSR